MKKVLICILCSMMLVGTAFAGGSSEAASAADSNTLTWWEHFETLTAMNEKLFEEFTAETGMEVEYTLSSPDKMIESLLVGFRSNQLPDVFSLPFDDASSVLTMFNEGWFQPLGIDASELPADVAASLCEGRTLYNGEIYSLPIFSKNHTTLLFYHPSMVAEDELPTTYQEFYESCKKVYEESNGEVYGLIMPMAFTSRVNANINELMDAAGSPVLDYATGEYQYNSDDMKALFALMAKLWDEGLIHPSSVNFNMKQARERWAAGEAAYMIDGIWNVGITKMNFDPELADFGVTDPIRPEEGDYMIYDPPQGGTYYVAASSNHVSEGASLIKEMIEEDYQIGLANVMDQPPADLSVLAKADVDPSYIKGCEIFSATMGYEPYPALRNPDTSRVMSAMRTVTPTPCDILNGYFAGAIKDLDAALDDYNQKMTEERNLAIEKVQAEGYDVSVDDWKFDDFVYGESYAN